MTGTVCGASGFAGLGLIFVLARGRSSGLARINDLAAHSSLLARAPFIHVDLGDRQLGGRRQIICLYGLALRHARRSRRGSLISPSNASSRPIPRRPIARHRPVPRLLRGEAQPAPRHEQLLALQRATSAPFLPRGAARASAAGVLSRTFSALRMFYKFLERRGYGKNDAIRAVSLAEAAAFGAEAAHRAEGDRSGRWRRYRFTRCAGMDPGARHRRACAALRLGLAHLGGAVARTQGRADQGSRHAARARGRATRRGSCRCCRSCARRSSVISRSAR